jgi:hypothetical protein
VADPDGEIHRSSVFSGSRKRGEGRGGRGDLIGTAGVNLGKVLRRLKGEISGGKSSVTGGIFRQRKKKKSC